MYEDAAFGGWAAIGFIVSRRIKDRWELEVAPKEVNDWPTSPLRYAIGGRRRECGRDAWYSIHPIIRRPIGPPFVANE